ncbi:MAG: polysulfide reductase chain A [Candidatus Thiodiazotropha sp.]
MRFPQVPIGQSFFFEGRRYTKTGIMTASEEGTGRSCMIRRSAEVTLQDESGKPRVQLKQDFSRDEVLSILQGYRQRLLAKMQAGADSWQDAQDLLKRDVIDEQFLQELFDGVSEDASAD